MRPCRCDPPLCRYKDLTDGTYSINDLADFHEQLDVEAEYALRWKAARAAEDKK